MVSAKPEVPVFQLLYKIAKKFQRLTPCFFGVREFNGDNEKAQSEIGM
jgi:hypothetical protein